MTNPASSQEVVLGPNDLIISKTDPKGIITYANRKFMEITSYREDSLLGKPHSLIRHPDMPRGVFRLLWKTLQKGQEFFGIVKNYTATGDYYWVFANITPDYGHGNSLQGYYSVRRPVARAAVEKVVGLYEHMCEIEKRVGKAKGPDASVEWLLGQITQLGFKDYEQFVLTAVEASGTKKPRTGK